MVSSYRADHVGSLLRPPDLLAARTAYGEHRMTPEQLRAVEDQAIRKALELQREVGIEVYTDGEYRRSWWAGALAASVEGLVPNPDPPPGNVGTGGAWQGETADLARETLIEVSGGPMVVGAKLRKLRPIVLDEAAFLKQHAPGPWKITLAGVANRAAGWFKPGLTDRFYPTVEDLVRELVGMLQSEIRPLLDLGVSYIQLDSLRYTSWMDPRRRAALIDSGADLDKELEAQIAADNAMIEGVRRAGVVIGHHICRGNNRSAWSAEGGYEPVAERLFNTMNVDRFLLEYDTERAGGFEPLRYVPKGKTVVLGLISSKDPRLESQDDLLRRIDEASKYVPIENLAISPQCGFASTAPGNMLTWDDQRRKLELVVNTARRAWG